jgi:hypothetical protein
MHDIVDEVALGHDGKEKQDRSEFPHVSEYEKIGRMKAASK